MEVCLLWLSIGFEEQAWSSGPLYLDTELGGLSRSRYAALLQNLGNKASTCPHALYQVLPGGGVVSCVLGSAWGWRCIVYDGF